MKFKSPDGKVFDNLEAAVAYSCEHRAGSCCGECPLYVFCGHIGWMAEYAPLIPQLMGYEVIEDTSFKDDDLNPGDTSLLDEFLNELQVG